MNSTFVANASSSMLSDMQENLNQASSNGHDGLPFKMPFNTTTCLVVGVSIVVAFGMGATFLHRRRRGNQDGYNELRCDDNQPWPPAVSPPTVTQEVYSFSPVIGSRNRRIQEPQLNV